MNAESDSFMMEYNIVLLAFLLVLLLHCTSTVSTWSKQVRPTPYALAILSLRPDITTFYWAFDLPEDSYTIFFISDESSKTELIPIDNTTNAFFVHVNNELVASFGYQNSSVVTMPTRPVMAWDKTIFLFAERLPKYSFMWILEDDVFVRSHEILQELTTTSFSDQADLTVQGMYSSPLGEITSQNRWHWDHIVFPAYTPPYYFSLVCMMGMSNRLLTAVKAFVHRHHRLEFVEAMFHTIAAKEGLKIHVAKELSTMNYQTSYLTCDLIAEYPNNVFHPMKQQRQFIGDCVLQGVWSIEFMNHQDSNSNSTTTTTTTDSTVICNKKKSRRHSHQPT